MLLYFFALVITNHQDFPHHFHTAQVMIVLTEEKKMKHLKIKLQGKGEVGPVRLTLLSVFLHFLHTVCKAFILHVVTVQLTILTTSLML